MLAAVLVGGKRNGVFYDATIVENVPKGTNLRDAEAFGPVVCIEKFSDFKKVCFTRVELYPL
jgi:glyceraldehyde-3-phosphate dehydrogenase (NADP+)